MNELNYEIVELPERMVVGMGLRTRNDAPDMTAKIGGVWAAFLGEGREKLNVTPEAPCFGLYTNYDWADGSYEMLAAAQSEAVRQRYRFFSFGDAMFIH